jgi:hypothetical protein
MGQRLIPPDKGTVEEVGLRDALEERYLAYALSTIMNRALPDARDGLKPVHRRILYGMRLLRLDPGQAFKKSAKVVGDVMGNFHPHGDQAIYDALVRLAQDFAQRYPLVDGQGNFGNIDGDNAAAMRYTEARLTEVARLLIDGIDEDAVDFRGTYDGTNEEPIVLPAAFPNLLANGSQGILSAWRPPFRRTTPPSCATLRSSSSTIQKRAAARCSNTSRDLIFRPAGSSSTPLRQSPKPTTPAAVLSASARDGNRKTPAAAPT